jgi:spore maturation protein CgeB
MKDIAMLKSELLRFQKQILDELKPYLVDKQSFLDASKWFFDSPDVFVYNQHGKLYVSSENSNKDYISYLEKNNSFKYIPNNDLKILPNEDFEVILKGETLGRVSIWLMLVEYSQQEKLKVHPIPLNKKMKIRTTEKTNKIRLALRVSGTGIGIIEDVQIERLKGEILQQSLIKRKDERKKVPQQISDIKMACILDEFSMTSFGQEVNLITFTPENWLEVLSENIPDVLFVESAWRGNYGSWEYKIAKYNNQDKEPLIKLLNWCKENGIPTVFWNKEDPIHFERFIDTAKLFDYIFTTDANMIENYQKASGHSNVFALPFAAEPKLHNPIKIQDRRIDKICFAGSFYANRHEERRKDMENILDIAAKFGLEIYDRNYDKNANGPTDFSFPERFSENIVGSLKYDEIDKAYKGYKVMLNVNSVKYSPTMFSRRVFEGLACGTPIISSYSEGIKRIFKDIVLISENEQELEEYINKLMTDEDFYRQKSLEGIREVYLNHTYKHRIQYMFEKMGITISLNPKKVSVISVVKSKEEFFYILERFENQTWKEKELVVFVDLFEGYIDLLNQYNNENIKTFVLSYMNHYLRLTEVINNEYVAYFNPKNYYGENYLLDLMIATEYSQADVIGKSNTYSYDRRKGIIKELNKEKEYEYVSDLYMDAAVMKINIFHGENIMDVLNKMMNASSTSFYFRKGFRLLSVDKYNFVKFGFDANQNALNKIEK